jgi:NADH-ubiquinone oxidoreductase chain 5
LYFIMRFHYLLYSCPQAIKYLFIARVFTSFYAGINTMFEVDLKKLIALSTLSHLGFIGMAFSMGLLYLSFFHLLVHALFKSLLFMTIGDIMINLNHAQDARYLSGGYFITPFSVFLMSVSLLNLLGMPSLRGFFSKDLVLETISYSNGSWFVELILYINVIFTYYYTYKLFFFSFSSNKLNPYQLHHSVLLTHVALMCILAVGTLVFSSLFMGHIFSYILFYSMPFTVKFIPLFLNIRIFSYLLVFLAIPTVITKLSARYGSSILFLSNILLTFSSNSYYSLLFSSVKSSEFGFINYSVNSQLVKPVYSLSSSLLSSLYKVQSTVLSVFLFIIFLLFISLFVLLNNIIILYMTVTHNIS